MPIESYIRTITVANDEISNGEQFLYDLGSKYSSIITNITQKKRIPSINKVFNSLRILERSMSDGYQQSSSQNTMSQYNFNSSNASNNTQNSQANFSQNQNHGKYKVTRKICKKKKKSSNSISYILLFKEVVNYHFIIDVIYVEL